MCNWSNQSPLSFSDANLLFEWRMDDLRKKLQLASPGSVSLFLWIDPHQSGLGHFKPNSNPSAKLQALRRGSDVEEVPCLCYKLGLSPWIIKKKNTSDRHHHPRMMELCPQRSWTWERSKQKKLFKLWLWIFSGVFFFSPYGIGHSIE